MMNDKWVCRCEARRNRGQCCHLCMGRRCWNTTYEFKGTIYHLVEATMLWELTYYDGPLSGIAIHKGIACYAKTHTHDRDRSFWLYPLEPREFDRHLVDHAEFIRAYRLGGTEEPRERLVQPDERDRYLARKPLGFFRLRSMDDPRGGNRLLDQWWADRLYGDICKEMQS